ncbi:LexA regulated protein [Marinomonas agarivorans]|nr:LexA regulated protein [Marinomonas agarivorans]
MAKSSSDRSTIDLFSKTRGRPRTHLLSRQEQLKASKKVQRIKQKQQGLKRMEVVLDNSTLEKLDLMCTIADIKRADWISEIIEKQFASVKTQKRLQATHITTSMTKQEAEQGTEQEEQITEES